MRHCTLTLAISDSVLRLTVLRLMFRNWGKCVQGEKVCPSSVMGKQYFFGWCFPGYSNGMMFSIETLAGCVTLDLTTNMLVVRSMVALFRRTSDCA